MSAAACILRRPAGALDEDDGENDEGETDDGEKEEAAYASSSSSELSGLGR